MEYTGIVEAEVHPLVGLLVLDHQEAPEVPSHLVKGPLVLEEDTQRGPSPREPRVRGGPTPAQS